MPKGGWYNWLIVGIGAVFWVTSLWWWFRAIRARMAADQENMARRESSAYGWTEGRAREIMERHPRASTPKFAYAQFALHRREWEEALRRFELALTYDPRDARGYAGAAAALRGLKRLDESDALLRRAAKQCKDHAPLQVQFAWNATARQNWHEAARRWSMHRQIYPKQKVAYEQGERALRKAGLAQEADALAAETAKLFPRTDLMSREEPARA
jgi:tetratricopeptide (TPR) repeat protein